MNQQQKKYLLEQLHKAWKAQRYEKVPRSKEPPAVIKARKLVDKWDKEENKRHDAHFDAMAARYDKVRRAVLFGTDKEAVMAVKEFEAGK